MENNNHQGVVTLDQLKAAEQDLIAQAKGLQMTIQFTRHLIETASNPPPIPVPSPNSHREREAGQEQVRPELPA